MSKIAHEKKNTTERFDLRHFAGKSLLYLTASVSCEHEVDNCTCQVAADHHTGGTVKGRSVFCPLPIMVLQHEKVALSFQCKEERKVTVMAIIMLK